MQIRNVYGIDLGTSTVKIYDLKKDTITKEKNMIAIRNREQVIAVGNYAYEMHERTPSNIEVITPMSNGRIANVLMVEAVLHTLLHRCTRHMGYRPELYFSVPCDMTEIERRSYYTIAHKGALKNCRMYLVDKPIADALALGIPINRTKGSMIVNIGAQSTEISVIANARVIFSRIIPVGGKQFNESICNLNRRKNNFQIGSKTAKRVKIALADLGTDKKEARKVRGVDGASGLPMEGKHSFPVLMRSARKSSMRWSVHRRRSTIISRKRVFTSPAEAQGFRTLTAIFRDSSAVRCSFPSIMTSVPSVGSRN